MRWKASASTPPFFPPPPFFFSRLSVFPPGGATSCVVVPQPDALQLPQTVGGSEEEQIHGSSLKDALLRVGQVMRFAVPLGTQQSERHLEEFSEKRNT